MPGKGRSGDDYGLDDASRDASSAASDVTESPHRSRAAPPDASHILRDIAREDSSAPLNFHGSADGMMRRINRIIEDIRNTATRNAQADAETEIRALQRRLSDCEREREGLREQLQDAFDETEEQSQDVVKSRRLLASAEERLEQYQHRIAELERKVGEAMAASSHNASVARRLEGSEAVSRQCQSLLENAEASISALRREKQELQSKLEDAEVARAAGASQLEAVRAELALKVEDQQHARAQADREKAELTEQKCAAEAATSHAHAEQQEALAALQEMVRAQKQLEAEKLDLQDRARRQEAKLEEQRRILTAPPTTSTEEESQTSVLDKMYSSLDHLQALQHSHRAGLQPAAAAAAAAPLPGTGYLYGQPIAAPAAAHQLAAMPLLPPPPLGQEQIDALRSLVSESSSIARRQQHELEAPDYLALRRQVLQYQREVASLLAQLLAGSERSRQEVAGLSSRLAAAQADLAAEEGERCKLQKQLDDATARLREAEAGQRSLQQENLQRQQSLWESEAQQAEVRRELEATQKLAQEQHSQQEQRLRSLEAEFDARCQLITDAYQRELQALQAQLQEMDALASSKATAAARLPPLEPAGDAVGEKAAHSAAVQAQLEQQQEHIRFLEQRVEQMQKALLQADAAASASASAAPEAAEAEDAAAAAALKAAQKQVSQLQDELAAAAAERRQLNGHLHELQTAMLRRPAERAGLRRNSRHSGRQQQQEEQEEETGSTAGASSQEEETCEQAWDGDAEPASGKRHASRRATVPAARGDRDDGDDTRSSLRQQEALLQRIREEVEALRGENEAMKRQSTSAVARQGPPSPALPNRMPPNAEPAFPQPSSSYTVPPAAQGGGGGAWPYGCLQHSSVWPAPQHSPPPQLLHQQLQPGAEPAGAGGGLSTSSILAQQAAALAACHRAASSLPLQVQVQLPPRQVAEHMAAYAHHAAPERDPAGSGAAMTGSIPEPSPLASSRCHDVTAASGVPSAGRLPSPPPPIYIPSAPAASHSEERPAPPEVLWNAAQYEGGEGYGRPRSAAPSDFRARVPDGLPDAAPPAPASVCGGGAATALQPPQWHPRQDPEAGRSHTTTTLRGSWPSAASSQPRPCLGTGPTQTAAETVGHPSREAEHPVGPAAGLAAEQLPEQAAKPHDGMQSAAQHRAPSLQGGHARRACESEAWQVEDAGLTLATVPKRRSSQGRAAPQRSSNAVTARTTHANKSSRSTSSRFSGSRISASDRKPVRASRRCKSSSSAGPRSCHGAVRQYSSEPLVSEASLEGGDSDPPLPQRDDAPHASLHADGSFSETYGDHAEPGARRKAPIRLNMVGCQTHDVTPRPLGSVSRSNVLRFKRRDA